MAIELVYRVINPRNETVVGEYMDKKTANIMDNRIESMYALSDFLATAGVPMSEADRDKLAEFVMDKREDIKEILKNVKDIPLAPGTVTPVDGTDGAAGDSDDQAA